MALPEGLYYIPNFIDDDELDVINNTLDDLNFEHVGNDKSRVVAQYGHKYNYLRGKPTVTDPIPDILGVVTAERLSNYGIICQKLDQLIVNKYLKTQSISAHIDHTKYFGPVIACLSIGGQATATFTNPYTYHKYSMQLEEKSLYVMTGKSRYDYKHEISKPESTRYSLTYRTVI